MYKISQSDLLISEEEHKEAVYRQLDEEVKGASDSVKAAQKSVDDGWYEDQEAFTEYGKLSEAQRKKHDVEYRNQKLYKRPYFAHIEIRHEGEENNEHYYLSDCESLDKVEYIGKDGFLIPFKQDKNKPLSSALFHCYHTPKGDPVSYKADKGTLSFIPQLICDDKIDNRLLMEVVQLFPEQDLLQINADELLEEKLSENRNNPELRNIIATLQRLQFEIIEADINQNFVVQGCAGSGKSQCLLHRLFFLRDSLSQEGWEHVLLLTPTQLFRNYSADLIKRYRLSSVENCTIADLYHTLLNVYDSRFKNRQYRFELSEEYLPDEYLSEVYDESSIEHIDSEIQEAIMKYVSDGCTALGIDMPEHITSVQIDELVKKLDEEIKSFDARESVLQQDEEYAEKRKEYENLQKNMDSLQKKREKLVKDDEKIAEENEKILKKVQELQEAEEERAEWLEQRQIDRSRAVKKLSDLKEQWNTDKDLQLPARYAQQTAIVRDLLYGERHQEYEDYKIFLDEYCKQLQDEFMRLTGNKTTEEILKRQEKKSENIRQKTEQIDVKIDDLASHIDEYSEWIRNYSDNLEGEKSKGALRRKEMEVARYFLSRIESTVFEKEVWNALAPLKEKYNIETLQVEKLENGRQKESRILYKSDVLFYLKIYKSLYPNAKLPDYRFICVDEGQDLHKADYDMIHRLYPDAVLNVFGDTNQVLHTACGINEWKADTGIEKEYLLNRNYRNNAAIVDFCNREFGSSMEYIGSVNKNQKPEIINEAGQMKNALVRPDMALILKDRKTLEQFCAKIGKPISDFDYLDTKAEKQSEGKIPCYSIFAAKGLEFKNVAVYAEGMTKNQKVVACTRAMEELYYYE